MKAAILIAPTEFRDETVAKARAIFNKWNVEPVIAGFTHKECIGAHGAVYKPEINVSKLDPRDFDIIFLADGPGVETYKLYDLMPLLDILRVFSQNNKIIAGVNNSIKIMARANIVANKKISIPKDVEIDRLVRLYKGQISENEMECGTNIMTLRDYTDTEEFVGQLLDRLGIR